MSDTRAVCYVVVGDNYVGALRYSLRTLRSFYDGNIQIHTDRHYPLLDKLAATYTLNIMRHDIVNDFPYQPQCADGLIAREIKTRIMQLCPNELALFLDVDTLILAPLEELWESLGHADDIVLGFTNASITLGAVGESVAHKGDRVTARFRNEFNYMLDQLGRYCPYYSSSTMLWRRTPAVLDLSARWYNEWRIYAICDMLPLARALADSSVTVSPLPHNYNDRNRCTAHTRIYTVRWNELAREYDMVKQRVKRAAAKYHNRAISSQDVVKSISNVPTVVDRVPVEVSTQAQTRKHAPVAVTAQVAQPTISSISTAISKLRGNRRVLSTRSRSLSELKTLLWQKKII